MEKEPRVRSDRHIDPSKRFRVVWRRAHSAFFFAPITELDDRGVVKGKTGRDGGSAVAASDPDNSVRTAQPPVIVEDNMRIDGHEAAM